ncbi:MAG: lytic transglycosylase domain-containing protein [Boseongicola sp.]
MARISLQDLGLALLTVVFITAPSLNFASTRPGISAICDTAAMAASRRSGVPIDVLRAISLTETGRRLDGKLRAWPWTVNMEGAGKWFDDRSAAQAYVDVHAGRGARSFDVGCFQLNYRWHGDAFASIEEMFDPQANADYAANFLRELYSEFGDWPRAAGAYHSRTPKFARKYQARFERIRKTLGEPMHPPLAPEAIEPQSIPNAGNREPRLNTFPLLQDRAVTSSLASLVPLPDGSDRTRFIQLAGQ